MDCQHFFELLIGRPQNLPRIPPLPFPTLVQVPIVILNADRGHGITAGSKPFDLIYIRVY